MLKPKIIVTSVIGPSHIDRNLPNQDAVFRKIWGDFWLVVVCDGLGSRKSSHIGAKVAYKTVYEVVYNSEFDIEPQLLTFNIHKFWHQHLIKQGVDVKEANTTCLFAWGHSSGRVRLFQLGDGIIVAQTDNFYILRNKVDKDFSNETTALGISKGWSDWSYATLKITATGQGIALMTDGISDDITDYTGFMHYLNSHFCHANPRKIKKKIKYELIHWKTPYHSDDKSIGLILF